MLPLIVWLIFIILAFLLTIIVICLIAKPMRQLLGANPHTIVAQSFYIRAFALTLLLGTLASIVGRSPPGPTGKESMAAMEYVWWMVEGLSPAFWNIALFMMGFVALLSIVFAVLGRYRDQ